MLYPGTVIEFDDQSAITSTVEITTVKTQPLYMATFTSDKGPEEWGVYSGSEFFDAYGNDVSFSRHGQPLLQAAMSINWGAKVLCKRVVADDALLANLGICAQVTSSTVQKTDSSGNLLYIDGDGNETTEVTETLAEITKAVITYIAKTATNVSTVDEAITAIKADIAAASDTYFLWMFYDVGRGVSKKRIMITPNYTLSKSYDFTMYTLSVLESGDVSESFSGIPDPDGVYNSTNISFAQVITDGSAQIKCKQLDSSIEDFFTAIQTITEYTDDEMSAYDILFGCTKKGVSLDLIEVDSNGINLQNSYGQALNSGSNGTFGTSPIDATDYSSCMVKAWDGTYSKEIYSVDQYKLDAIVDANYPTAVKRAIEDLVTFREDCMYFRDMGVSGLTTVDLILLADEDNTHNMFCSTYCNYYDIKDPYSKKQVTVTVGYDLARILVSHFNNGRARPLAGTRYGVTLDNAIDGTLNFAPIIYPSVNEKESLGDAHINYASYIDSTLVMESLYTSQEDETQFSFINNVLITQEVVKAIRNKCPSIRYTFMDGDDFSDYKTAVNTLITSYSTSFNSISFEYAGDDTYAANKIFYGVLAVKFRNFVQTEYFKVTALSTTTTE